MKRFASEGRVRRVRPSGPGGMWMFVLAVPALVASCSDDDAAGGGSYVASATQTTEPPATTTEMTPTTGSTEAPTTTSPPTTSTDTDTTDATTEEPPPPLQVDCGALPKGAQGAKYEHTPTASGGVPKYTWSASGLPEGLTIDPNSGEISGVPTTPGEYVVELTVSDVKDNVAMATCSGLTVGEMLKVDYDALMADGPCVVAGGKTILDYVTGGDGSPITCATPGGVGDGKLPLGLGVDAQSCAITGTLGETRYGGWGWMVAAEQSGVKVYAPYCAVQTQQAPKAYAIVGDHSGKMDNALEPMVVEFNADEPLRFDGDADPRFEVTKPMGCGNSCFFGFLYRVSMSPFGTGDCKSDKDGCFGLCPLVADANEPDGDKAIQCSLLPEMGAPKTGFAHEMWAKGEVPPEAFKTRPFIIQWSVDYCLSDAAPDCQGKDAILANGDNSSFEFPVIFRPQ